MHAVNASPPRAYAQRAAISLLTIWLTISLLIIVALLGGCDRFVGADTHAARAAEQFAKGDYRSAMAQYKSALQKEPEHVAARLGLAKLSWWLGDVDSAEKEIERATAAGAGATQVRDLRYLVLLDRADTAGLGELLAADISLPAERRAVMEARIALLEKDRPRARAALDRALAAAPADPEALLESARLSAAEGNNTDALELPDRVRSSPETHARALYLRGAIQMSAGAFREACDSLAEAQQAGRVLRAPEQLSIAVARTEADLALNDAAAAERSVARVEAWAPQSGLGHYLRARIATLKGDFVTAVAECQRALRTNPQHFQSQLLLASSHYSLGALEQAQDVLRRLLAGKPDAIAARKLLAQVYLARNQSAEAQQVLGADGQGDADTDWLMGSALLRSGSVAAGIEHLERSVAASPSDVGRRLELASAYIGARQPDKAVRLLADVPAESPLAPKAKMLTVLAAAIGKPRAEARQEVTQLAARNADDPALLSAAGTVLANLGDAAGARRLLQQAIAATRNGIGGIEPRLALARVDVAERKLDDARKTLQEVLGLDPKSQAARVMLAEIDWSRGEREAARKWLEEAITSDPAAVEARVKLAQLSFAQGDGTRARALLDQALQVSMDRKTTLTAVGRVLARAGLGDEALARFKDAAAAGDREALLEAARLHVDLNDLNKARESANSALALDPSWPEAQHLLAMIDARDGQVDRAFERAKRLLERETEPATLALLKGDLHAMARDYAAAEESYAAAQRQQPSAQTAIKLYQVRRSTGASSPERSLTQWLERSPSDAYVRRVLALHYESLGQTERAIAEYERLLAGDALDPLALNNLAWWLHQKGDARALDLARKAHETAPQYAEIADTYGWILVRMGKVSEGLGVLQNAVANAPANPDILYHAAAAYRASGNTKEAAKLVNEALKSKGDFVSRAEAVQLSRELSQRPSG